ncbi:hypothetical protein B0H13DRAFT_2323396 [Mycena leptocephala]|nr:hypothetical protein B0H13DRAFT_2323396 [Mycena leptocephala]
MQTQGELEFEASCGVYGVQQSAAEHAQYADEVAVNEYTHSLHVLQQPQQQEHAATALVHAPFVHGGVYLSAPSQAVPYGDPVNPGHPQPPPVSSAHYYPSNSALDAFKIPPSGSDYRPEPYSTPTRHFPLSTLFLYSTLLQLSWDLFFDFLLHPYTPYSSRPTHISVYQQKTHYYDTADAALDVHSDSKHSKFDVGCRRLQLEAEVQVRPDTIGVAA